MWYMPAVAMLTSRVVLKASSVSGRRVMVRWNELISSRFSLPALSLTSRIHPGSSMSACAPGSRRLQRRVYRSQPSRESVERVLSPA